MSVILMPDDIGRPVVPVTHPNADDCTHPETISVISAGVEIVICEVCGHVAKRYESMIRHDVDRSQFTRRADVLARARSGV